MLRLKSYASHPPGGFGHPDLPSSEGVYNILDLARVLSDFRKGNSLPRSSITECFEDIDVYTATRIRNTIRRWQSWVVDTDAADYIAPVPRPGGCGGCGSKSNH